MEPARRGWLCLPEAQELPHEADQQRSITMKKPMKGKGHGTSEKPQGKIKGSGVNKKVDKASIPQIVAKTTYGKPSQRQKM